MEQAVVLEKNNGQTSLSKRAGMSEEAAERLGGMEEHRGVLTRGGNRGKPWEHAKEELRQ